MIRAPIETSLSTKKSRLSNIFSKMRTVPYACVATDDRDRGQVGGERRPDAALDLRDLAAEVVLDEELLTRRARARSSPSTSISIAELAERRHDRDEVVRLDVLDRRPRRPSRPRDRRSSRPRCAPGRSGSRRRRARSTPWMCRTFEPIPSISAPSETRKRQRSWMCGSQAAWPSDRLALGEHRGHDRVLGPHHGRLVEVHARAAQPVGAELVDAVDVDVGAERGERVDVRVEAAAADHVAARRRHGHPAEAREQRPGEQERGADLARELGVEVGLARRRADRRGPRSRPSTRRRRRGRRAARPSSRRRGSAARSTDAPRSEASTHAARIGSAPFLLPDARTVPESGRPPSMTKDCIARAMLLAVFTCSLGYSVRLTISSLGIEPAGSKPSTCA